MNTKQKRGTLGLLLTALVGVALAAWLNFSALPAEAGGRKPPPAQPGNVIVNGNFEAWAEGQPVATHWPSFSSGPAHFGPEIWPESVFDGEKAQLIGLKEPGSAGIYQTVPVVRGEEYELTLRPLLRTDEGSATVSNHGYRVEYALDFSGGQDGQAEQAWTALTLPEHPRQDPQDTHTYEFGLHQLKFIAPSSKLTLWLRVVKVWPTPTEVNVDFDGLSLRRTLTDNLLVNGNFESDWPAWLGVAPGWIPFDNGQAHVSYYNDTWPKVVYEGRQAQLIEIINNQGVGDRFGGIYQTVTVESGIQYELDIHYLGRSDEGSAAASNNGYHLQYGLAYDGSTNWQAVEVWLNLPFKEQLRQDPAATNTYEYGHYRVKIRPTGNKLTLFIRGVKKWPGPTEGNFDLDAISLRRISLMTGVQLDKETVCLGEELMITAQLDADSIGSDRVVVLIDGEVGNPRVIHFSGQPGQRLVQITVATTAGDIDSRQREVTVIDCGPRRYLEIYVRPNPYHRLTVDFSIANAADLNLTNPSYLWEFGDGQIVRTTDPFVSHDYSAGLKADQPFTVFTARVRVAETELSSRKTVTLWNLYYLNKQRGFIQPAVTTSQVLQPSGSRLIGDYTIQNLETEPIRITAAQREFQPCDLNRPSRYVAIDPAAFLPQTTISGGQILAGQINLAPTEVPADVCWLAYHFNGQAADPALAVHTSLYFEVKPDPALVQPVADPALRQFLTQLIQARLVGETDVITSEDLYRLEQQGKIRRTPAGWELVGATAQGAPAAAQGNGPVGETCQPGEQPPRPGLSCQVTTNEWTVMAPHIVNARKGDIVLTAGCTTIGNLLKQVAPPQLYSHTGIMTKNKTELRQSTAEGKWYTDHAGSDGFDPDALRYGWPGTITQAVVDAYEGEYLLAPDGNTHKVEGFNADPKNCGQDSTLVEPVLVKPLPQAEAAARPRLEAAADAALQIQGHYRFYGFTDGSIAHNSEFKAPPEAGWAAGTWSTVCATFIWSALKEVGIELEGNLELADILLGAGPIDPHPVDGLYLYTEPERRAAAEWLYSNTYNKVLDKAGWLGRLVTDAPDDIANQLVNCFAFDACDRKAKDSEAWRNPGPGRSVSPDNLFFWDGLPNGVYGYNEPLIYRSARYVRVYRWQPSAGTGTVTGQVLQDGQPVAQASVSIAGLELFTDFAGRFEFVGIPAGRYEIEAGKVIDDFFYSDQQLVEVLAGQTRNVTLQLQPPPAIFRRITVQGDMHLVDDENFPDSDEEKTFTFYETANVNPWNRNDNISIKRCVGGEVRAELDFHIQLRPDNTTVVVPIATRLYEGTSCSTNDEEDHDGTIITLPADTSASGSFKLRNSGVGGGDKADITFTITNSRQP